MSYSFTHSLTLLAFFASASVTFTANHDRFVKFPTKEVLQESFHKAGLSHFMEKTKIEDIVNCKLVPLGVAMRLECKLYDYNEYMKSGGQNPEQARMFQAMMEMSKPQMLEILLQADPAAREELKSHGLLS